MAKYGDVALAAVARLGSDLAASPQEAWDAAAGMMFGVGSPSQRKGCPRAAFLGLCDEGLVRGVARGEGSRNGKNAGYALKAVNLLRADPSLASGQRALWAEVVGPEHKAHNGQMDVVLSLWNAGEIP
jgi:hypothetical protein